ncbi:Thioredoxin domain-containing protein [Caldalkalibacillus thermarum TA2.A1]|uniref:Thioredoxin domain-containing protein n=1 Tax=Caldalkalibacillus thermarum (strain TA2.A1) TaxID=986075 RepID=F5LA81_CALTT|nr:thioredoxin family protein [Caldalkalibacillus thermarum]EGL81801.1 Thioredoxin domain-containing protein [Caldalkalibacillus thermarum TA2.A1]QZT34175.1 thioredoxin family protein [Caldalkalibacillus thermarum TA2.A1]
MQTITSVEAYDQAIKDGVTVMLFSAEWCPDCRFIEPFMPEVEEAFKPHLTMYKVDRDQLLELCQELNVFGIPSFIAYRKGKEIMRFVSKERKTREQIETFLNRVVQVSQALEQYSQD